MTSLKTAATETTSEQSRITRISSKVTTMADDKELKVCPSFTGFSSDFLLKSPFGPKKPLWGDNNKVSIKYCLSTSETSEASERKELSVGKRN